MFDFVVYSFHFEGSFSRKFNTFLFAKQFRALAWVPWREKCPKFQYGDSILQTIDSGWVSGEIRNGHRMLRGSVISALLLFQVEKDFRVKFKFPIAKCLKGIYFLNFWNSVHSTKGDTAIIGT